MNKQHTILMLVGLLVISCSHPHVSESVVSQAVTSISNNSLQQIRIGYIELKDASGYDAVNFIFEETNLSLDNRVIDNNSSDLVTLSQNNASIYDLLNEVCRQAHLEWLIEGQLVIVKNISRQRVEHAPPAGRGEAPRP